MPSGIMEVIPPFEITDAMLTSSDVAENDESEWLVGTAYVVGDLVMVTDTGVHKIYECMVDSTGDYPPDNIYDGTTDPVTGFWKEIGATNRWKMFDQKTGSKTVQNATITTEITPGKTYNSVAGFGIVANTVNVTVTNGVDEVYNTTVTLKDITDIVSYYTWFFQPTVNRTNFVLTDLPIYSTSVVTVTVENGTDDCELGELVVGKYLDVGVAEYGTQIGVIDFSRKIEDKDTGEITIEKRRNSKYIEYGILLQTNRLTAIRSILNSYTSTPMVFVGDEDLPETIIYGFFNDFTIELRNINTSSCNLQAEELV